MIKLQLSDNHLTKLQSIIKKLGSWQEIHKEVKDDKEIHNDHRHQTLLSTCVESDHCVKELMKEVGCIAKIINKDLVIQSLTPLHSKTNDIIQTYYSNFTDKDLSILEEEKMLYSCLLSFNKETRILIKNKDGEETKIIIPRSNLLFFLSKRYSY